jgi:Holliday junction resolvase
MKHKLSYLYRRETYYERKAMHELIKEGYLVIRSTKSSGIFDLWALNQNELKLLQIKATKSNDTFTKLIKELEKVIVPAFCSKELWIWIDRKGWNKIKIMQGEVI